MLVTILVLYQNEVDFLSFWLSAYQTHFLELPADSSWEFLTVLFISYLKYITYIRDLQFEIVDLYN